MYFVLLSYNLFPAKHYCISFGNSWFLLFKRWSHDIPPTKYLTTMYTGDNILSQYQTILSQYSLFTCYYSTEVISPWRALSSSLFIKKSHRMVILAPLSTSKSSNIQLKWKKYWFFFFLHNETVSACYGVGHKEWSAPNKEYSLKLSILDVPSYSMHYLKEFLLHLWFN